MDELIRSHITPLALESFSDEHGESGAPPHSHINCFSRGLSSASELVHKSFYALGRSTSFLDFQSSWGSIHGVLTDEAK